MVEKKEWTEATWEKIVAHSPTLVARLKKYTRRPEDAEDAAQEAMRRALRASQNGLDEPRDIPAYMATAGRRILIEISRKEHNPQTGAARTVSLADGETYNRFLSNIEDTAASNPDASLRVKEVLRHFENLKRPHKEVFTMYLDGYSHGEIAKKKGMPEGSVKSTIHRVQEDLKKRAAETAPTGRGSR